MLTRLLVFSGKELRVLFRDREALAILFIMPVVFVTIMSLALADFFRGTGPRVRLVVLDADSGVLADAIVVSLQSVAMLDVERRRAGEGEAEAAAMRAAVQRGAHRFALFLPAGLSVRHAERLARAGIADLGGAAAGDRIPLPFVADPAARGDQIAMVHAALAGAIAKVDLQAIRARFSGMPFSAEAVRGKAALPGWLTISGTVAAVGDARPQPSATQQNVPAYALLAVFMLVVPLSGTFIRERQQGSLARLASMPVPAVLVLGGKVLPFLLVNVAQIALCFAVGRFLLPVLGADALAFNGSPAGIVLLSLAASAAAIGFGLAVAVWSRTAEQATAFGATAVLIAAAVGGIMVPKPMMPAAMQSLASISPLGWALDGYLDLFARGAHLSDVLMPVAALSVFALGCLALAAVRYPRAAALR